MAKSEKMLEVTNRTAGPSGTVRIIEAVGRVDGTNASELSAGMSAAIEDSDSRVVLDLDRLSYISSAGLRAVLITAQQLTSRAVPFAVCRLSGSVAEVFRISGFDQVVKVHRTLEDAAGS